VLYNFEYPRSPRISAGMAECWHIPDIYDPDIYNHLVAFCLKSNFMGCTLVCYITAVLINNHRDTWQPLFKCEQMTAGCITIIPRNQRNLETSPQKSAEAEQRHSSLHIIQCVVPGCAAMIYKKTPSNYKGQAGYEKLSLIH